MRAGGREHHEHRQHRQHRDRDRDDRDGGRPTSSKRGYFLCVRLPEDLDSRLHSFVEKTCDPADLLDNHGNKPSGPVRLDLHVTFTRRIPATVEKEHIKKVVKEEAAKRSATPIILTVGSMYCGKVNRIEHDVHCIGIPLSSPELDELRSGVAAGLEGADKGYGGAGHISMAYFHAPRATTYEPLIKSKEGNFAGQSFELKEVDLRGPDGSWETISLYD